MSRLIGRAWVPMVMVVVVAVGALNVQFKPKRVIYEVYGPAATIGRRSFAVLVRAGERCRRPACY
jgi:hypothetical protein